jgi:hypothetical protein
MWVYVVIELKFISYEVDTPHEIKTYDKSQPDA